MRKSAQTEQDVLPIVGQCLEGIQRCTDSINEKEVRFYLKRYFILPASSEWLKSKLGMCLLASDHWAQPGTNCNVKSHFYVWDIFLHIRVTHLSCYFLTRRLQNLPRWKKRELHLIVVYGNLIPYNPGHFPITILTEIRFENRPSSCGLVQHFHVSSPWLRMSKMPRKILTFHIFYDEYGTIQHYDTKIYGIRWSLPAPPFGARNE